MGLLQGVLEFLGQPYTGSGVAASAIGMDKLRTKQLWIGAGLPTPKFAVLNNASDLQKVVEQLGSPMIVKPAHEGSSIGMSKVTDLSGLAEARWQQQMNLIAVLLLKAGCRVVSLRWRY